MEITGKRALVTGGAVRLGRALALALARAGADVVIGYHSSARESADAVRHIEGLGRRGVAVRADVSSEEDVRGLVEACRSELGGLDILVNSAALFESAPLADITRQDWDRVLAVNLTGPFLLSREAAPLLRAEGGGVIVNMADLSAFQPWPSYAHHAVSKAGLVHLTRVLARALAPEVRVCCIAPGTVLPPESYGPEDVAREEGRTVLGGIGSPDDVAKALLYLVESDFVTGEVLVVDGGRMLR